VNTYLLLKFVHVASVVAWIGSVMSVSILIYRLTRTATRETVAAVVGQLNWYGQWIFGPASLLALITGVTMVYVGDLRFGALWVTWGFVGVAFHILTGTIILRKRTTDLAILASNPSVDDARVRASAGRLWQIQLLYLAVMATVVAAMVVKPTI
jgi:uncharacterized membrane protein